MALKTLPKLREMITARVMAELEAERVRETDAVALREEDIVDWMHREFYIPSTMTQIKLAPQQICILRYAFTREPRRQKFPYQTVVYSTIKKSGKSTIAGGILRWMGETQVRYGELFAIGNDLDQAKDRSFREVRYSLEITPGYNKNRKTLPGRWALKELTFDCIASGSKLKAIAVDAKGEAGGKQALTVWTELWGYEDKEALRFWDEMTPIPTEPDSIRLVETYAGYDGESELLQNLYNSGMAGRQLTAHEMAMAGSRGASLTTPGQTYEELLYAFAETEGDPNALVPVWVNEAASLFMYWDDGLKARRMPWQLGEEGDTYYRNQEATLPQKAFLRLHHNLWVGAESQFVPIESWDACYDKSIETLSESQDYHREIVLAVDAATTHDCFAIVALARNKDNPASEVDIIGQRKWVPKEEGGVVQYEEPEKFLRLVAGGGCRFGHPRSMPKLEDDDFGPACAFCVEGNFEQRGFNVVQICYDPYQLESMMQRLRRDRVAWCSPFSQQMDRLKADRALYDLIIQRRLHHKEDPRGASTPLREHVLNANAKLEKDQDSKLRIIKKAANRNIDLTVAASMGAARCLYLQIGV